MGHLYAHNIEKAAKYLVDVMDAEESIDYTRFYDGSDETDRKLQEATGLGDNAIVHMDTAVYILEENGVFEITPLESLLADGENNFLITWTGGGRELIQSGEGWKFCDVML